VRPGDTPAGLLFEVGSPTRRGTWDPGPIHPLRRVALWVTQGTRTAVS